MSRLDAERIARGQRLFALIALLGLLGLAVAATRPSTVRAEGGGGALVAEPVLPATSAGALGLFGPSPAEAPGEVWGVGTKPGTTEEQDLIRYTDAGGWEILPEPTEPGGGPISGMEIPTGATAGRTTPAGGVVVAAVLGRTIFPNPEPPRGLLVRDPGGAFHTVVPPEGLLGEKEELFAFRGRLQPASIRLTAIEEPGGKTGAFVVPQVLTGSSVTAVLHYDGQEWTREQICLGTTTTECEQDPLPSGAAPSPKFRPLAIDASGPENAWMLAQVEKNGSGASNAGKGIVLLHREDGEWRRVVLGGSLGAVYGTERSEIAATKIVVNPYEAGQPLTVTTTGVWADGTITIAGSTTDATIFFDPASGQVTGAWCGQLPPGTPEEVVNSLRTGELPSDLPHGEGRSFAWSGNGGPGQEFGARAITGVGKGAMLLFENGAFTQIPLDGNGGSSAGAAIAFPSQEGRGEGGIEGWLGPSYRLTREPIPSGLVSWPVPFRRPLLALASEPGAPVGAVGTEALAVGESGQVARYIPGVGWQPESLLTGTGARATSNLRAVAWPVPGLAYAVGDEGAMWIWRKGTGLWEADPGAPPNLIRGNFTGIAFDPNEPERGYAVGQQGLLLGYGRRWTQEPLPPGTGEETNFTSIAFAGDEAIAACSRCTSGVVVNDGSGWRIEPELAELLKTPEGYARSVRLVAGLPDGGAAIATTAGEIFEREGPGAPWHLVPGAALGVPVALQAVREGGQVRAIVSVEANAIDAREADPAFAEIPQGTIATPPGQAPLLIEPYGLPASGYIVRQTATGWRDEQRQSYPIPPEPTDQGELNPNELDMPKVPDPVLAFLVSPDGSQGWAVGGQTASFGATTLQNFEREGLQTAAVMRFGEAAAPPQNASTVGIPVPPGEATFAIGGNAQCVEVCADLAGTGIGPDVWLKAAVAKAAATPGVRAFLYTGASVPQHVSATEFGGIELGKVSRTAFSREEAAYANRLGSTAGALPVFAAPAESDLYESSLSLFAQNFSGFDAPLGLRAPPPGVSTVEGGEGNRLVGNYSYAFDSTAASGGEPVRILVLDYATAPLGSEEQCWLAGQLAAAKAASPPRPAIVIGSREVGSEAALSQLLVSGSDPACPQAEPGAASAYFYDAPEENVASAVAWGGATIPAFGTGSLGYIRIPNLKESGNLNGYTAAAGFLRASVDTSARDPITNIAPVTAQLIPSIGSLAINALDGTLLRRSQVALFEALARRPEAGFLCSGNEAPAFCDRVEPDSYVEIPAHCVDQSVCVSQLLPEYRFSSSRPDIADFVKQDPASTNLRAVYLNAEGKPEADPTSGLLCAFNSGTTTVSIEAGGLSYSVPVTVQAGSVARPCGTVPRTDLPVKQLAVAAPPPPPATQPPFKSPPGSLPPPPAPTPVPVSTPLPIPATHPVPHHPAPQPPPSFFVAPASVFPVPAFVPPPPPTVPEPAPPSGTSTVEVSSPVAQSAVAPEEKREAEVAVSQVHHMSVYAPEGFDLPPAVPIVALAALVIGGCGLVGTRRRERLAYVPIEDRSHRAH